MLRTNIKYDEGYNSLFAALVCELCLQSSEDEEDMYGGAWCAEPEDKEHWFQVDARREVEFTGVITQGKNSEQL